MNIMRISPHGLEFSISEVPQGCEIRITGSDKRIIVAEKLEKLSASWYVWQMRGDKIQHAFPYLKPSEREFLITGITPEEWNRMFPPKDGSDESIADKQYKQYKENFPNYDSRS